MGTVLEREWLEIVADLMETPPPEVPAQRLALQLGATFDLVACAFEDVEAGRRVHSGLWPESETFGGYRDELFEWGSARAAVAHPVLRWYRSTGRRVPAQSGQVPFDVGADVRREWYEVGAATGCPHHLALPLRLGPGAHRAFVMGRATPFGPSEVAFATLLWRLLTGLDRQLRALVVVPAGPVAEDLRVTPRQRAVLGLLAEGMTAAAIGRRLGIAERTVHKHLEHLYGRLGVADRLSAVLRARDIGLLAPGSTVG